MTDEDIYQEASKKVQAKKGFFYHLIAYAFVIGMLYAIIHFENNGEILPVIVVGLSWGIGLAVHYFRTFGTEHLDLFGISPNWEEEELEHEVEKLKRERKLRDLIKEEKNLLMDSETLELKEIQKRNLDKDFQG